MESWLASYATVTGPLLAKASFKASSLSAFPKNKIDPKRLAGSKMNAFSMRVQALAI
jgi:hypothetical protein